MAGRRSAAGRIVTDYCSAVVRTALLIVGAAGCFRR
jgi:hypothetical protein